MGDRLRKSYSGEPDKDPVRIAFRKSLTKFQKFPTKQQYPKSPAEGTTNEKAKSR